MHDFLVRLVFAYLGAVMFDSLWKKDWRTALFMGFLIVAGPAGPSK